MNSTRCSVCGREFSESSLSGSEMFLDAISQKGFTCTKCGLRYCLPCLENMPKSSIGAYRCKCGNSNMTIES